ncbi:hypothetical protein JKP88DRAFT_261975 [Tribonema minus]|uniref:Uncharacterized protein n=1 Tax=Tribonema minus TaxID=303371 RepID=A0A835ZFI6_9STRA|nr:hypothetical protein JKP88DRAFT_261975 [Tribonema minus]
MVRCCWSKSWCVVAAACSTCCLLQTSVCEAFVGACSDLARRRSCEHRRALGGAAPRMVLLPENSPYAQPKDEPDMLPKYKPMPDYPGSCQPGTTAENAPLSELDMTVVIPYPHFQTVRFHDVWQPAHDAPLAIKDFIEEAGLWDEEGDEPQASGRGRRAKAPATGAALVTMLTSTSAAFAARAAQTGAEDEDMEDMLDDTLDDTDDFLDDDLLEDALGLGSVGGGLGGGEEDLVGAGEGLDFTAEGII